MSMTNIARPTINTPQYSGSAAAATTQDATNTATPSSSQSTVSPVQAPTVSPLQKLLADLGNLRTLASGLRGVDTRYYGKPVNPSHVAYGLNANTLTPHQGSSYASLRTTPQTLATVITDLGFKLPTTVDEVAALATDLEQKALQHPLGNLAGALSWPVPMSNADLEKMQAFLHSDESGFKGQSGYLFRSSSLAPGESRDPVQILQKILDDPRTLALGHALQKHMQGISTDASAYDYVLALIQHQFDPESSASPERNKIAGFDLLQPQNWGLSPYQVVQKLSNHLIAKQRSNPVVAGLVNHLVLARNAPQFLIKDIPPSVTVGSLAWANLCIATAAIEAGRPGAVANMTFAEVMSYSTSATPPPKALEQSQAFALIDWAVASGVIAKKPSDAYTPAEMERIKTQFNQQLTERLAASEAIYKEIPSRKEMALSKLRELFKDEIASAKLKTPPVDFEAYFEKKILSSSPPPTEGETWQDQVAFETITWETRKHSPLDIVMMGISNLPTLKSSDVGFPVEKLNNNPNFGVREAFEQQLNTVITNKRLGITTLTQHLISQLPLEDRKNFEYGAATFYQRWTTPVDNRGRPTADPTKNPNLWVKIEREGKSYAYRFNINDNAIVPVSLSEVAQTSNKYSRQGNTYIKAQQKEFTPTKMHLDTATVTRERAPNQQPFDSFNTSRSINFGKAFSEHLDVDDPTIKSQARGQTPWEAVKDLTAAINEFFLDLIPFRWAIVNFQQGNIGAGLLDLTLDAFGFLTAGAGAAGKLTKIGSSALSAGSKALKATQVIGATTIGALNPLSGAGDLLRQVGKGGQFAFNKLKGATGSYDLLKAASKHHGITATGTYKVADQTVEIGAVRHKDKWYALDTNKNKPYGAPLQNFAPDAVAKDGAVKGLLDSDFGNWLATILAPSPEVSDLLSVFRKNKDNAEALYPVAFNRGYTSGNPADIPGYFSTMSLDQLKALSVNFDSAALRASSMNGASSALAAARAEHMGCLVKTLEKKRVDISVDNSRIFESEITAAGGTFTSMPQGAYLGKVDPLSEGECAALANSMALAIQYKQEKTLIKNLHTASEKAETPASTQFRNQMTNFQGLLEHRVHGTAIPDQGSPQEIINVLTGAQSSKTLLIRDKGHVVLAGVKIDGTSKEWFYYDPNFGLATFSSEGAMKAGLESSLSSGRSNVLMQPYGADRAKPEYKYAPFNELELMNSTGNVNSLSSLFNKTL